jgi:hypothetical protein
VIEEIAVGEEAKGVDLLEESVADHNMTVAGEVELPVVVVDAVLHRESCQVYSL